MKKTLFTLSALLIFLGAKAQDEKVCFGFKGGLNISTISIKSDNALGIDKNTVLPSFNVGLIADIPLSTNIFSFQPALSLTGRGSKTELIKINDNNYGNIIYKPFYLELQTNIVCNIPLSDNFKIFLGVGPYAAAGIYGKATIDGKLFGAQINKDYKINYTNNNADISISDLSGYANMKRFDVGVDAVGGVIIGKIILSANYVHGLVNVQPGTADNKDDFGKTRSFNITFGFIF